MRYVLSLLSLLLLLAAAGADEASDRAREIARRLADRDPAARMAALEEAAEHPHPSLVGPVARFLRHDEMVFRKAALAALALQKDPAGKKAAAKALAARLPALSEKEETTEELLEVVKVLHDLAQPVSIKPLLDKVPPDADRKVVQARLMAVANVPDKQAIEALLRFGSSAGRRRGGGVRRKLAGEALAYATQVKLKGGIEAWRQWWRENERSFDFIAAAEKRAAARKAAEERHNRRDSRNSGDDKNR